ncbi:hypothetical protein OAO87_00965 [bacterium]|nr:hypothetical protein [bacterium]
MSFPSARASPHPGARIGWKREKCARLRKRDSLRARRSAPNQLLAINVGMIDIVPAIEVIACAARLAEWIAPKSLHLFVLLDCRTAAH